MLGTSKQRRIKRVRAKIFGTAERPRLAVYRSNRQISAQLIDDQKGVTLVSASSFAIKENIKPMEKASKVGAEIANKAKTQKIMAVVFDRRDKKYHGQVKSLAEAARENGLKF